MVKKFGKRSKGFQQASDPQQDPRYMFDVPPLPRQSGEPASSAPLADYLATDCPGVDDDYVVLPRSLVQAMTLPWQQQLVNLLAQFHRGHSQLSWPTYRVVPSRRERLVDLDEEQLAEAGYLVEIDAAGELIYRERSGRQVAEPHETTVLVPCLDPIAGRSAAPPLPGPPVPAAAGGAAPMNVEPPPVWPTRTAESSQREETGDSGAVEFGPTGEPTEIPYRYWR